METLESLLLNAKRPLFFTGAGMSTGSGIPDFRGPKGIWKTRKPVMFQDFLASEEAREEYWDYKLEGFEQFRDAEPNDAHRALAELERSSSVIELHGTNREIECVRCGTRTPPAPAFEEFSRTRRCPLCECGGYLKSATVSFGQAMPEDLVKKAFAAAEVADLAVSIGSTLEVQPAALVPLHVLENGAPYVVINRGATAHDRIATLRLEGDVNEILPAVVERLKA
jgi:NAD-dependent deacetylase